VIIIYKGVAWKFTYIGTTKYICMYIYIYIRKQKLGFNWYMYRYYALIVRGINAILVEYNITIL